MTKILKRESLIEKLESVAPGLSARDVIEQSSCYVFKDGKVFTFNDEIACSQDCDIGVTGAVHSVALLQILHKLNEDEITLTVEEGELILEGKKKKIGITRDAEVQLPIDSVEQPSKWRSLPEGFIEAIEMVQHCASSSDESFSMTCVHITPDFIEACDNIQMARADLETGIKKSFLVRRDSIKHIVNLAVKEISETETWIHFRNESGLVLSCRRFADDYVDLTKLLDVKGSKINLPKGLDTAADKASVFVSVTTDEPQVMVTLLPGKLLIKSTGVSGWYREAKNMTYDGPKIRFMISPQLLIDISKKYNDAVVMPGRLKVNGGNWNYVSCLSPVEE